MLVDQQESSTKTYSGGTPRAAGVFPHRVPPLEALIEQRSLNTRPTVAGEI
jgi:hypothetical protein